MTTLTFANNTIMAYVGPDAGVVGVQSTTGMPVWTADKTYFIQTSNILGPGIRQFNIDPDGSETLQRTKAAIGITDVSAATGGAACITLDGTLLYLISIFDNSVQLAQIRASDLVLQNTFGVSSASVAPSTSTRILAMHAMLSTPVHLVCATEFSSEEMDSILTTPSFSPNTNLGNLDTSGFTFGVMLGPGSGLNDAFALGLPFANGVISAGHTSPMSLYKVTSSDVLSKIGSVSAANIDATWTRIFTVAGIAFDATDGNLLFAAMTDEVGPTNTAYIVKINSTTAAVMWTRPINTVTPYPWSFTFARITQGRFHYLDGGSLARHINTADGSQTTETVTGLTHTGPQFSDDVTSSVIFYGTFTAGGSPPNYVGTYMGPPGNNHNVTGWMRFWFAYTGTTYAAALSESASAVDVINAPPPVNGELWLHEYGLDETGTGDPVPIRSYFETPLFGGPRSDPPTDDGMAFQQLEPDIKQSGDMVVWVAGSWNARAGDFASNAAFIKQNPATPQEQLIGLQTARRLGRLHFESYTLNGDYVSGRSILHVDKADMHKMGGTSTPPLTADALPAGASSPPLTETGTPLEDFLP